MEQNQQSSLNSALLQPQQQYIPNQKKTTQLFDQLLKEFKLYYLVAITMNLLMCSLFATQYFRRCNDVSLDMWMLQAFIIFFIQFVFYVFVIVPSYNAEQSYFFAEQLNEVIYDGDVDPYYQLSRKNRTKKRKRIENLIRSHFKNYRKAYWFIDISLTICDLGLIVLGIVFFCMHDYFKIMFTIRQQESFSQDCAFSSSWITFWSIVLLCISRKNAFQLLLLIIISLPVLVCYIPIKLMKQDKQRQRKNLDCLKILKSMKYHPNSIEGDDHSCSICRIDYTLGVSIKVLPCSTLHHFHSSCVKTWFKISPTCPLCRKELGLIIDDIRSNQGQPSYLILDFESGNQDGNLNNHEGGDINNVNDQNNLNQEQDENNIIIHNHNVNDNIQQQSQQFLQEQQQQQFQQQSDLQILNYVQQQDQQRQEES